MEEKTSYIQESLFSFEDLQKMHTNDWLLIIFSVLDLRPYVKELRSSSPRGADGHSIVINNKKDGEGDVFTSTAFEK